MGAPTVCPGFRDVGMHGDQGARAVMGPAKPLRGSGHHHTPSASSRLVEIINLERNQLAALSGLQFRADPGADENALPVERVVDREDQRKALACDEREPPDLPRTEQSQALCARQGLQRRTGAQDPADTCRRRGGSLLRRTAGREPLPSGVGASATAGAKISLTFTPRPLRKVIKSRCVTRVEPSGWCRTGSVPESIQSRTTAGGRPSSSAIWSVVKSFSAMFVPWPPGLFTARCGYSSSFPGGAPGC